MYGLGLSVLGRDTRGFKRLERASCRFRSLCLSKTHPESQDGPKIAGMGPWLFAHVSLGWLEEGLLADLQEGWLSISQTARQHKDAGFLRLQHFLALLHLDYFPPDPRHRFGFRGWAGGL